MTEIIVRSAEDSGAVCLGDIGTYYVDGPLSTVGTKIYAFDGIDYNEISYAWVIQIDESTAYEYDEGITGDTYICS